MVVKKYMREIRNYYKSFCLDIPKYILLKIYFVTFNNTIHKNDNSYILLAL